MTKTETLVEQFLSELGCENTQRAYKFALSAFFAYAETRKADKRQLVFGELTEIRGIAKDFLWESGWKASTAKSRLAALSSFYQWLVDESHRTDLPTRRIKLDTDICQKETVYPSPELADRLIEHIESRKDRWAIRDAALIKMLREAGLRSAELLALKLQDIDRERGLVFVSKAKRKKKRYTGVSLQTANFVHVVYANAYTILKSQPLFPSTHNVTRPITRQTLWNILRDRAAGAGFSEKEIVQCNSPHGWRHLWTTEQIAKGVHPEIIKAMGGWTTGRMIQDYLVSSEIANVIAERNINA